MAPLSRKDAKVLKFREPPHAAGEDDTETIWQSLRRAIQDILEKGDSGKLFDELYRQAYEIVVQGQGALLHNGLREVVTRHLGNNVRPAVATSAPDAFLRTLNQAWNNHQSRMKRIRDIVMYMEQMYVPENNVCSVHNLGLFLFRDEVVRHEDVRDKLRETLLQTVSQDREGEIIDKPSLKNACQMLVELGVNSRSVYEEDFELPFLDESAKFYALESQKHLTEKSAIDYIDMTEQRMNAESERAKLCLDPGTEPRIQQVVYQELVANHVKVIVEKEDSGIVAMLKTQNVGDLTRMFGMLSRAENGLKALAKCVSKYLRELGRSLMTKDGDQADSLCLVKELMDLKDRFEHLLNDCFKDKRFVKQIITADFEYILSVTRKSAEHVAVFADDMLRMGIRRMANEEAEKLLDKIVLFIRFLHEKDLFQRFYQHHLSKRLLLNRSASDYAERVMVSKLKFECGPLFTSKFEAMLKDMSVSKTLVEDFKTAVASNRPDIQILDLNVRVLTTGFWPLLATKEHCSIPSAPFGAFEMFRRFYLAKHSCRVLTLQAQLGWAELKAEFYPPGTLPASSSSSDQPNGRQAYIILVSTYQMCVLLLFNSREKITYEDIASATDIPEASLVRALQSLTQGRVDQRVLVKEPPTSDLEAGHVFSVNESYTSDLPKVKIGTTSSRKEDSSKESETVVRNLDEDRRFAIEAAIVRIMKSERKLSHNELVAKLTELLSSKFTPSPEVIKKRIEALIDRVYLERDPENAEVYVYVP